MKSKFQIHVALKAGWLPLVNAIALGLSCLNGCQSATASSGFTLTAAPSSQVMAAGGSTSFAVFVNGDASRAVSLHASGLPFGVEATFNPSSITGQGSSTMTILVNPTTSSMNATIAITGVSGVTTRSATVNLAVTTAMTQQMLVTFYGWIDNSPPGDSIAYPIIHSRAGGTGTFTDPITFATNRNEYAPGTIIYVPYLSRYFIMEDDCAQCDIDWQNGQQHHIDIWTGGSASSSNALNACEVSLTRENANAIVDPPNSLPALSSPLFTDSNGQCFQP